MNNFKVSLFVRLLLLISASAFCVDLKQPESIIGCQGEGCDCFQGYKAAKAEGKSTDFEITTIRPFHLYKEMTKASSLLGTFNAGIKAKPLEQKLLLLEKGEYTIKSVKKPALGVKAGDKVDTLLYDGEGIYRIHFKDKWLSYDETSNEVTLTPIRKTKVEEWLQIKINGMTGYTQDSPFELCLE